MFSRDVLHLWVLGIALLLGGVGYAAARTVIIPASFGKFGAYRGDALTEAQARPIQLTTRATCIGCHTQRGAEIAKTSHAKVHCTDCHGQAKDHIQACQLAVDATKAAGGDPQTVQCKHDDLKPDALRDACLHCHTKVVGRPVKFPQIVALDHLKDQEAKEPKSPNVCAQCHNPHNPAEEPDEPGAKTGDDDEDDEDEAKPAAAPGAPAAAPATPAADDDDD